MGQPPRDLSVETEPGRRTPGSPGERGLLGLFLGTALVTAVVVVLNFVGTQDTSSVLSPSPSLADAPSETPIRRDPPPPPPNDLPDPSFAGSFAPLPSVGPASSPQPGTDPWLLIADHLRGRIGEEFGYHCPPDGEPYVIWGTDLYTDDSSVCTAAVHAGLITLIDGGDVTIVMMAGQDSYQRSLRHGVQSLGYPAWHGSFQFVVP